MSYIEKYENWRKRAVGDSDLIFELESIKDMPNEIEDRFYRDLEFGTGGLRGIIGAGSNRMNIYTVSKASQGYSNYLKQCFESPSVAIAYDSRIKSKLFAEVSAGVFAGNGIKVHIFEELMPTPVLSYAIRKLKCCGGIVITASHNPANYNGYKVYGSDGCQITNRAADNIYKHIKAVDEFDDISAIRFEEGLAQGKIKYIAEDTVTDYIKSISKLGLLPENVSRDIKIVYTPLNGTGLKCVTRCLEENGFKNIIIPEQQKEPDGIFATCPYPNPEIQEALAIGLECARETGSELLIATDPDCDRVGSAVKTGDKYTLLNGNQMGVLLLDYICRMRNYSNTMPERPVIIKTIVTSEMAKKIAEYYHLELIEVLTGFKFIGEQIGLLEAKKEESRFIFGFEESYGYLSGVSVRDKDGVNAALLICEIFAYYKAQGLTLIQALEILYKKFGYYSEKLVSMDFEGVTGFEKMQNIMSQLRAKPLKAVKGYCVSYISDYLESVTSYNNGSQETIDLPKSDVIKIGLECDASVVIRPSGTEPKLKIYYSVNGRTSRDSNNMINDLADYFSNYITQLGEK